MQATTFVASRYLVSSKGHHSLSWISKLSIAGIAIGVGAMIVVLAVIDGFEEDAIHLKSATVHWLRHTSISHDVQHRPREHVRDDAGHHHVGVTDQYVEIDLEARYVSARDKPLIPSDD